MSYSTAELPDSIDFLELIQLNHERYPHLLESRGTVCAEIRFDMLFAFPEQWYQCDQTTKSQDNFLRFLSSLTSAPSLGSGLNKVDIPFRGGWFVFFGYEFAGVLEPRLRHLPAGEDDLPLAFASRHRAAVIRDRLQQRCYALAETGAEDLLRQIIRDVRFCEKVRGKEPAARLAEPAHWAVEAESRFMDNVAAAKRYIDAGDIFQANLSRMWRAQWRHSPSPVALYHDLHRSNPGGFSGISHWQKSVVVSSSPERLVEKRGCFMQTRPIAGTCKRGASVEEDRALRETLLNDVKERAEHVMLVDMERNDLGRVCLPGSIHVSELMTVESYAYVHHLVSNIRGRMRSDCSMLDIIRSIFPGGSITGCPKIRCMEIIAELENRGRSAYTGSMGYINHNGDMDLNILIRTWVLQGKEGHFSCGAGIVHDSDPGRELLETEAKAAGLLRVFNAIPS